MVEWWKNILEDCSETDNFIIESGVTVYLNWKLDSTALQFNYADTQIQTVVGYHSVPIAFAGFVVLLYNRGVHILV